MHQLYKHKMFLSLQALVFEKCLIMNISESQQILDHYINSKDELKQLQKKALENSTKFSLEKLRNEFLNNIKELNTR